MNALDPAYMKGFNDGVKSARKDAEKIFHEYLVEKMQTLKDIPGIGDKTAWKIQEHFLQGVDKQGG